ncbi:MAG: type II DNA modification enzyme [Limisphaerales bacterium]|nr:MAG: type II DNA modification enzyme [Limisphaerales bacterium]TXT49059.1 MAG: type II DNA modification enzyme [Limisphaerales bacterium]
MANRKTNRARAAQLGFEALVIEGGLLSPEWLSKVAQLAAETQTEADYRIPKGLNLRDEIGRYWRIAQAHWKDFALGLARSKSLPLPAGEGRGEGERIPHTVSAALAERFILGLLRESFGFTSLAAVPPAVLAERNYPLGHAALGTRVPVVIAPAGSGLDALSPAFGDGSRRRSPFGLVQEYLNAADGALWGLVTDGLTLRVLRDNASLTRPAWIEADLARIFTEERYADFAALWLLLHESRFGRADQPAAECALETWREAGKKEGTRAREHLRRGVEDALVALGQGFLAHPENQPLRAALQSGVLTTRDYFSQLLRLVYRLIFLLTVEERNLLHTTDTPEPVRRLYAQGYALWRLCEKSVKRSAHDRYSDLWDSLNIVLRSLADGETRLGLPALAGIFAPGQCPALDAAKLENRALLLALFKLAWLRDDGALARVNWRDMGPEELGSVYESLLELVPQLSLETRKFGFAIGDETKGNARKTTGSYYTPDSLVQVLLDSALEPVIADTIARHPDQPVQALLALAIVDPACGSGHFLLAAARRLAAHVARLQADGTPSAAEYRHALRQVVGKCIYGVDLNPMAVELCKVSLWMEAVEPGLPLTFLNSHIQHGNALLGTTPDLMAKGIPDVAWEPIEGDDRKVASALKKRNKQEAGGQRGFDTLWSSPAETGAQAVTRAVNELEAASDADAGGLARKEAKWEGILTSAEYRQQKFVADAWCAAFVWPKQPGPPSEVAPTNELWRQLRDGQGRTPELTRTTVGELAGQYRFFHWHLQFPQVFAKGGFDVVLGNPPWERVKLQEQEFFASRSPETANAVNAAARKKLIAALLTEQPQLWQEWCLASRKAEGESHALRQSGRYPLCGKGDVNTYALFAEHNRASLNASGAMGCILPAGIATDDTTKEFFQALLDSHGLHALFHFENEERIFVGVNNMFRFVLLTVGGAANQRESAEFTAFARNGDQVRKPERRYALSAAEIATINPNTRTFPAFHSRRDADINLAIYRRAGVLWRDGDPDGNTWGLRFLRMLDMANDSGLFRSRAELEQAGCRLDGNHFVGNGRLFLPLVEAKMVHHFDHRFASYEGATQANLNKGTLPQANVAQHADVNFRAIPEYWVLESEVTARLRDCWSRRWFLGWRNITNAHNERTIVAGLTPLVGVAHSMPLMMPEVHPTESAVLYANLCSLACDYTARQKLGGTNFTYGYLKQLPVLPPATYAEPCAWAGQPAVTLRDWLLPRVLELTYTAWDLEPFARDCGWSGPPFVWDEARRFQLRCELDAAFLHLYGLSRADAAYLLDTFPIVRRKDEAAHGTYRTKDTILALYDQFAECAATSRTFVSPLKLAPASFRCTHAPRLPGEQRIALDSAPKFLLSFVHAFLRQTGEEATFDLLDSVFHLLRQRARHVDEFAAALGDDAKPWLAAFNDRLPNGDFLSFLKRLEADAWITADRHTGQLRRTEKFPPVPFDAWRNFDVSAALRVITQRPEVVRLILAQPDTPLASQEFSMLKAG